MDSCGNFRSVQVRFRLNRKMGDDKMTVTCPGCGWSAEVPDEKIPDGGVKATCRKCQGKFEVKKEANPSIALPPIAPPSPRRDTKPCPLCGEEILVAAIKCKHCNSMLDGSSPEPQKITVAQIDPFAEYHTPIKGKKKGRLTVFGYLGIGLGVLCVIAGFDVMAKEGTPNPMIIFGFGIMIGAYLWARKENDKNYVEPSIFEKIGFVFFGFWAIVGASQGNIGLAFMIIVAFVASVITKRQLITRYDKKPVMAILFGAALFLAITLVAIAINKVK
jgi:hypothetical protein